MITQYLQYKRDTELVRLPILSIQIACNHNKETIWALIDSGAEISVFNSEIAGLLNIEIRSGKQFNLGGIVDNRGLHAWLHQVSMTVGDLGSISTMVAFTDSESPGLSLLGQKGFFDNYQIRFKRFQNVFEVWPKSAF
jgi:hypothetical protein